MPREGARMIPVVFEHAFMVEGRLNEVVPAVLILFLPVRVDHENVRIVVQVCDVALQTHRGRQPVPVRFPEHLIHEIRADPNGSVVIQRELVQCGEPDVVDARLRHHFQVLFHFAGPVAVRRHRILRVKE